MDTTSNTQGASLVGHYRLSFTYRNPRAYRGGGIQTVWASTWEEAVRRAKNRFDDGSGTVLSVEVERLENIVYIGALANYQFGPVLARRRRGEKLWTR